MRVFISYSASDKELARAVASEISDSGHIAWLADDKLVPGENWAAEIARAIESSNAMVLILSEDSAKSPWTQREIDFALGNDKFKNRLITVVASKSAEVPWILKRFPIIHVKKNGFSDAGRRVVEELHGVTAT